MANTDAPLAERMRPKTLDDFVGQEHLVGTEKVIRKMLEAGQISSMIFWGPPGVGKTTLAQIIANTLSIPFFTLSAISSGVKDVRAVIDSAQQHGKSILFIDEIHRFNKAQQDSLLGAVERGTITLIGATTENPSFEVISALISRAQVYVLKPLEETHLIHLMKKAIEEDEILSTQKIVLKETDAIIKLCGGDGRKLLNLLELVAGQNSAETVVTDELVMQVAQRKIALYDKAGEQHYDIISAFIKSIRGSDPNGAVYWLARMIEGGEDLMFIARRLLILASEDIGNANPNALLLANSCYQAVHSIGYPEARIILSQTTVYLATSAKSNASYIAINNALAMVRETGDLPVPLHIRNAPTKLMKSMDYGKDYKYSHDYEGNFKPQEYLPEKLKGRKLYNPGNNPRENEMRKQLKEWWKNKYDY